MKDDKTNVMRLLDQAGIGYKAYSYECEGVPTGVEVAQILGLEVDRVFKTLVTAGRSGEHYVFVVPVAATLDLKKAATAVGEKSIEMIKSKDLLPLTGYIHGGCSPIGMKKPLRTTVDESCILFDTIVFSAGKIGRQVELSPDDLKKIVNYEIADLCVM